MQQKIILEIPVPCHESWDKMTASTQNPPGKFCGSCQKNVVDFTGMTDAQVLAYFSANAANTCGRFENAQLNRVLVAPPPRKKSWYKWVMAALVSGFMFSSKAKAQTKGKMGEIKTQQKGVGQKAIGDTVQSPIALKSFYPKGHVNDTLKDIPKTEMLMLGGISVRNPQTTKCFLRGTVSATNGTPIAGASVVIKGSKTGAATDVNGRFSIPYINLNNDPVLLISNVGFYLEERKVSIFPVKESIDISNIYLKPMENVLYENVVVGGYVAVKHPVKKIKIIDTLRKILPAVTAQTNEKLTISPNPAKAGSTINIAFAKAGEYQLQLVSLQSNILTSQPANIETDNSKVSFNLPAGIAKGEYFISAISAKNKIQLAGKLLIQ